MAILEEDSASRSARIPRPSLTLTDCAPARRLKRAASVQAKDRVQVLRGHAHAPRGCRFTTPERGENDWNGKIFELKTAPVKSIRTENGSSQGHNLALTGAFVSHSLGSGTQGSYNVEWYEHRCHLTESVSNVVLRKSTPPQIYQLILHKY